MSNFVDCERDQAFLLPPDLRDWIPGDDLAHFVIEAVERVGMSAFKVNHRGTGSAQYHPRKVCQINLSKVSRNSEPERLTLPLSRFAIPPLLGCG